MSIRLLGSLGILGGAGLLAVELRHLLSGQRLSGPNIDALDEVGYLVWGIGFVCAFYAIYRLRATGSGKWTRLVPFIAIAGFALMALGSALDILGLTMPTQNTMIGIAWLLILVGTLLTGIFALIARTWEGWRKFAPLLCILAIPFFVILSQLVGELSSPLFGLAWVLLGYAVFSSEAPAPQRVPVPA